jgi:hypothetical protein
MVASPNTLPAAVRKKNSTSSGPDNPGKSGLLPDRTIEANSPIIDMQKSDPSALCMRLWRINSDLLGVAMDIYSLEKMAAACRFHLP